MKTLLRSELKQFSGGIAPVDQCGEYYCRCNGDVPPGHMNWESWYGYYCSPSEIYAAIAENCNLGEGVHPVCVIA